MTLACSFQIVVNMLLPCLLFISLCSALNGANSGAAAGSVAVAVALALVLTLVLTLALALTLALRPLTPLERGGRLVLGVACLHHAIWFAVGFLFRAVLKPPLDFRNSLVGP